MRAMIMDADSHLGMALADNFSEVGHEVLLHTRTANQSELAIPGSELVVAQDPVEKLEDWFATRATPDCIVFNLQLKDELSLLNNDGSIEELISQLSDDLPRFLRELQAFSLLLARAGRGIIWVVIQEDSAGYYVPIPVSSIASKARIAAIKSVAKEVARLGVKINAISIQAYSEQLPMSEWKDARDGLKAFALKFKPIAVNDIATTICTLSEVPNLPIAGMVLPIGIGMAEFNI